MGIFTVRNTLCAFKNLQFANNNDYLQWVVNLQYAKSMCIGTYTVKDELVIFIVRARPKNGTEKSHPVWLPSRF
jgi:hypothetical protein